MDHGPATGRPEEAVSVSLIKGMVANASRRLARVQARGPSLASRKQTESMCSMQPQDDGQLKIPELLSCQRHRAVQDPDFSFQNPGHCLKAPVMRLSMVSAGMEPLPLRIRFRGTRRRKAESRRVAGKSPWQMFLC